jgi:hypothetical protein
MSPGPSASQVQDKLFVTVSNPETTAKTTGVRVADGEVEPEPGCVVSLSSFPLILRLKVPFCLLQPS